MAFVDVKSERTGKLLFRFDAERDLVEVVQRGERSLVDLQDYRPGGRLAWRAKVRSAADPGVRTEASRLQTA